MWQHCPFQENLLKSGSRWTLPVLPDSKHVVPCTLVEKKQVLMLDNKVMSSFCDNIHQIPSQIHNTMGNLKCRHMEISQWQTHMFEGIRLVDLELDAVKQLKDVVEHYLNEKKAYLQLIKDCIALCGTLTITNCVTRHDPVLSSLKKEEQLAYESAEVLQSNICLLLDKIRELQKIRCQLQADFRDKSEAIKLTTKCITYNINTPCFQPPAPQYKTSHVNYYDWLAHCKNLRLAADNIMKDSTLLRRNVRFSLVHLKSSHEQLRQNTLESLRKRIHDLNKIQETMKWERQAIQDEICDLSKDIQKIACQIRNCDFKLHQTTHCLEMLNQRPRYELCLDNPHISISLERRDLAKITGGLACELKQAHKNLENAQKRLEILEEKLARNAHNLQVHQKCLTMHQSYLPSLDNAVVLAPKPRIHEPASTCTTYCREH